MSAGLHELNDLGEVGVVNQFRSRGEIIAVRHRRRIIVRPARHHVFLGRLIRRRPLRVVGRARLGFEERNRCRTPYLPPSHNLLILAITELFYRAGLTPFRYPIWPHLLETYGQRWQVETTFSMLKRRLGSVVRARKRHAVDRECHLKAIVLNLLILVEAGGSG